MAFEHNMVPFTYIYRQRRQVTTRQIGFEIDHYFFHILYIVSIIESN
jgi:hypothetical protein